MKQDRRELIKKIIDEESKDLPEIVQMFIDLQNKIYKRCLYEGCRFGYKQLDDKPKDECIYCGAKNIYK